MARPGPRSLLAAVPEAKPAVAVVVLVGLATGIVALAQAICVAWAVTSVVTGMSLTAPLLSLVVLLVVRGMLAGVGEYAARRAGHLTASGVRSRVLRRWLALPQGRRPDDDEATTLIGEGVAAIEPYVSRYVPALVAAAVVPAMAVLTLAFVDVWSALIVVVTLPLLPLFAALIGMHTRDQTRRRWAAMTQLSGHFLDVVRGLPTLVAYGRAEQQVTVVREVGERHRVATVRTLRTAFMSTAALELLATISVAMVAVAVGLRLAYGTMDLQVGLTAILLAPETYWPIRRVGTEFHNAADGVETLGALGDDLTFAPPSSDEHTGSGIGIGVTMLCYAYPGRGDVLHELDLTVPDSAGLTALTGPSGTGKSTLLELLARLRTPRSGSVRGPEAHLTTQRPLLLSGTILDNLRITAPAVSVSRAEQALREVGLWDALEARSGLHTVIGDDGFGLSAGQRTRLALSRALLSPQSLVLLDEPTAHIATESLPQIHRVIGTLAQERRVIVATHDHDLVALSDSRWTLSAPPTAEPGHSGDDPNLTDAMSTPDHVTRQDTSTAPPHPQHSWWQQLRPITRLRVACAMGGLSVASGVALTATSGWLIVQASFQPVVLTLLVAIVGVRTFGLARPVLRYGERVVSHDVALADLAQRRADLYAELIPLTPARLGRGSRSDFLTAVVRDLDDVVDEQVRVTVPWWSTVIASVVAVMVVGLALPAAGLAVLLGSVAAFAVAHLGFRAERRSQDGAVHARGEARARATTLTHHITPVQAVGGRAADRLVDEVDRAHEAAGRAEMRLILARSAGVAALWSVVAATAATVAILAASAFVAGDLGAPMAALVALTPMALAEAWVALPEVCGAKARSRAAQSRLASVLDRSPAVTADPHVPALDKTGDTAPVHLQ
ncbi:MAG: thiol reductant ABC exporter subunit CydD, partial [Ornithinimicrobium sp.]